MADRRVSVSVHVIPQFQSVRSGVDIGDSTPRGFNIALLTHFARPTGFLSEILRDGGSESSDQFRRGRRKEEEEKKNKFTNISIFDSPSPREIRLDRIFRSDPM